jgi:hypothetical protein
MLILKVITLQKSTSVFYFNGDPKIPKSTFIVLQSETYNLAGSTHLKICDS